MDYKELVNYVNKRIIGRIALFNNNEAELLAKTVDIPGLHIEIGCLWGGTAVLAALVKKTNRAVGHIVTIDYMLGRYWNSEDPQIHKRPTPQDIYMNMIRFGVEGMISVLRCSSYPFPLAGHVEPTTAFIDGDHRKEGCLRDWLSLKDVTKKYILFHDYAPSHPGITEVIDGAVRNDQNWKEYAREHSLIVFERVK